MKEKTCFQTDQAAVTGGPYSQAVIHGGLIYVSGQVAMDPVTNEARPGTIEEESAVALENIRIILEDAGSSLDRALRVTVYLSEMGEYGRFNKIYKRYFRKDLPARTCIQAGGLPMGFHVEIDVIASI